MCTGVGTCVIPVVSVQNQLVTPAGIRAHTTAECAGTSYSMRGASSWAYVPDLLPAHGLCSYAHWQEYLYTSNRCFGKCPTNSSACIVNATNCTYYNFIEQTTPIQMWDGVNVYPNKLKMISTTCDRDYERFSINNNEMKVCVPASGASQFRMVGPQMTIDDSATYDNYIKTYNEVDRTVSIRKMPFIKNNSTGFLGVSDTPSLVGCSSVQQCYMDGFTQNGRLKMKIINGVLAADRTTASGLVYNPQDTFRCGFIGSFNSTSQTCVLDTKILPLFDVLCPSSKSNNIQGICPGNSIDTNLLSRLCNSIERTYVTSISVIAGVNIAALNGLFQVFQTPGNNLQDHLDMVTCAENLYSALKYPRSKGLYMPFVFTSYEFPFGWFYQCIIHQNIYPSTTQLQVYSCPNYERKASNQQNYINTYSPFSGTTDSFKIYISTVRGGYTTAKVNTYVNTTKQAALAAWDAAVQSVSNSLGNIKTYPQCYQRQMWRLMDFQDDFWALDLMDALLESTCSLARQSNDVTNLEKEKYDTSDLYRLLTYYDEASITPQTNGLSTLLDIIKRFGEDYINSQATIDNLIVGTAGSTSSQSAQTSGFPIYFNNSVPALGRPQVAAMFTSQVSSNPALYLPNANDQASPPPICPSVPPLLFNYLLQTPAATELAIDATITICPVYQQGLMSCHYPSLSSNGITQYNVTQADVVSGNGLGKLQTYFNQLYSMVYNAYSPGNVAHLPPSTLDFFEEEALLDPSWQTFEFDLTPISIYMTNINPNTDAPVMCTVGNLTIDYSQCTDPNFVALQDHVNKAYTFPGAIVVPSDTQIDWFVDRGILSTGAIFSYASTSRPLKNQYIASLLDNFTSCLSAPMTAEGRVCNENIQGSLYTVSVVSPWANGYWNPYDKCDVTVVDVSNGYQEFIDIQCQNLQICGPNIDSSVFFYAQMPFYGTCKDKQNTKAQYVDVSDSVNYNLCKKELVEDAICAHDQGMVGGTDGMPVGDPVPSDMYTLHNFTYYPSNLDRGIYGNPLFAGQAQDYGFLRVPPMHIGGTHIERSIDPNGVNMSGTMRVRKLPLKPPDSTTQLDSYVSLDVEDWVPQLEAQWESDDVLYRRHHLPQASPTKGWDCPFRRRAFYTGNVSGFGPTLPSGMRSYRMFGGITGDLYAHPTQATLVSSDSFGKYTTTNGFCYCPVSEGVPPKLCSIVFNSMHNCSLLRMMDVIQGKTIGWSYTFGPVTTNYDPKTCNVQLDWPYVGGNLRDGQTLLTDDASDLVWAQASDVEARACHVLDRMHDFAYSFHTQDVLKPSGFTSVSNGVCHTGRAFTRVTNREGYRCIRSQSSSTSATLVCDGASSVSTLRPMSATSAQQTDNMRYSRRRCNRCSPPPRFQNRRGNPIPPESSFGVPYRLSASLMLAKDLKEAVCGNYSSWAGRCPLNLSSWEPGVFLQTYLTNPALLFLPSVDVNNNNKTSANKPILRNYTTKYVDDAPLWTQRGWAYCDTAEKLSTGINCSGAIPRDTWRADKVGTSYRSTQAALKGQPDPMARTPVCNIDQGQLGKLCQIVETARSIVSGANCIASGDPKCAVQEFVYTPATWDVSNQEFVHESVLSFYSNMGSGICPPEPGYSNTSQILQDCAAVPVFAVQNILNELRNLVFVICQALACILNIVLNLIATLISPSSRGVFKANMLSQWASLKRLGSTMTSDLSDLLIDLLVFEGTMGPWIKSFLETSCSVINKATIYFSLMWCGLIVNFLPNFLGALQTMATWVQVGFQTVNDVFTVILKDYLPQAFITIENAGYKDFFQSALFRMKQPTYAVNPGSEIKIDLTHDPQGKPLSSAARFSEETDDDTQTFRNLAQGSITGTVVKQSSTLTSALGNFGQVAGVALEAYDIYNDVQTAAQIANALKDFPQEWTLFNFTPFYDSIHELVVFLADDVVCYNGISGVTGIFDSCIVPGLPETNKTGLFALAPYATQCWADAQQSQIGVTTLYACTGYSTCLVEETSSQTVQCSECPLTGLGSGFNQYGCDTLLRTCVCGTESMTPARCNAQRDCVAQTSTSCSLVPDFVQQTSFGSIQCSACATDPICLVTDTSSAYGTCTCLSNSGTQSVDLCAGEVGTVVKPDPTNLCGFFYGGSGSVSSYYMWSELALTLCLDEIGTRGICVEVVTDNNGPIYMSMFTSLPSGTTGSSRRRLLGLGEQLSPDPPLDQIHMLQSILSNATWNDTSPPCSTLAHEFQQNRHLGPVDEATAHSCAYWRLVGRFVISEYNLTALPDTFLLSMDDFTAALTQRGVVGELLAHPRALILSSLYLPWLRPVRALFRTYLMQDYDWLQGVSAAPLRFDWKIFTSEQKKRLVKGFRDAVEEKEDVVDNDLPLVQFEEITKYDRDKEKEERQSNNQIVTMRHVRPRRKLMSLDNVSDTLVTWIKATDYGTWDNDWAQCRPIRVLSAVSIQTFTVMKTYYTNIDSLILQSSEVDRSFQSVLPVISLPSAQTAINYSSSALLDDTKSALTSSTQYFIVHMVTNYLDVKLSDMAWLMTNDCDDTLSCTAANAITARLLLRKATSCDFEAVMYCSGQRRDLFGTIVFVMVVWYLLYMLMSSYGLSIFACVLFPFTPVLILWWAYGISSSCLPMLPTCLLDYLDYTFNAILPVSLTFPQSLVKPDGSLRDCGEIGINTWIDPMGFLLADTFGLSICGKYTAMLNATQRSGYRICAWVTSSYSVPALGVIICLFQTVVSLLMSVVYVLPLALVMIWKVMSMNHTRREKIDEDS